jgi:hypothetical protein
MVKTSVGQFPGSSGNHQFRFASILQVTPPVGFRFPFFSKMGLGFGFIFSISGVDSIVGSFFIFQVRPISVLGSITFGSSSNIQILA